MSISIVCRNVTQFFSHRRHRPTGYRHSQPKFQLLIEEAESGDAVSQFIYGSRFNDGDRVPRDVMKAARSSRGHPTREIPAANATVGFVCEMELLPFKI
jgi:hypothetical protein